MITLPYLDDNGATSEQRDIYCRFIKHLRHVPISRMEIKILSSIQFCADMMDSSDAYIAKELVEMGLRAPKIAFPQEFIDFMHNSLMRKGFSVGSPSNAIIDLAKIWNIGEEKVKAVTFRHIYDIVEELV